MPVGAGVEGVARVVGVHEVDAPGDGQHPLDDVTEVVAAGVGVAGVEAEADLVTAGCRADGIPQTGDRLEPACHGVVPTRGVLDEQRHRQVEAVDALAPVVEPDRSVLVLAEVAAVHDDPLCADLGGGVQVLLEELAARDPHPVVRRRDVDRVGRVDVQVDPGILGRSLEGRGAPGVRHDRALVALRVAEEDLREGRPTGECLRDGVAAVDVPTDAL